MPEDFNSEMDAIGCFSRTSKAVEKAQQRVNKYASIVKRTGVSICLVGCCCTQPSAVTVLLSHPNVLTHTLDCIESSHVYQRM